MKNRKWARNKGLENSMWWYIANEDFARLTELGIPDRQHLTKIAF